MFDYHVHTTFSVDCTTPIDASCQAAIAHGVTEIAFTDHLDNQPADPGYGFYRPDAYFAEIERVRSEYGSQLTVLAGVEVDYHDDTRAVVERFMSQWGARYDFVIGSVHYGFGGEIIFPEYFDGKSLDEVFLPYFDQLERAIKTGWFDTIGHLDLPKRYMPGHLRPLHGPADGTLCRSGQYRDGIRDQHVGHATAAENEHAGPCDSQVVSRGGRNPDHHRHRFPRGSNHWRRRANHPGHAADGLPRAAR